MAVSLCGRLCHENSWEGSLGVTLHIFSPTTRNIYISIQQQKINQWTVSKLNRHNNPTAPLGVLEWD